MTKPKKKTKAAASPAPAKKTVRTTRKPAAKRAAPAPAPAKPAVIPAAPAPKPVAPPPVSTVVTATINVGFGNVLTIRGEGPGLSWDRGLTMECLAADQWRVDLGEAARPFLFKFLVNDLSWSTGPDYTVASGSSVTLAPSF